MSWHTLLQQFKSNEFSLYPLLLLPEYGLFAYKILLLEIYNLFKTALKWCCVLIHITSMKEITHLKPQGITGAKPCLSDTDGFTLLHDRIPYPGSNNRRDK